MERLFGIFWPITEAIMANRRPMFECFLALPTDLQYAILIHLARNRTDFFAFVLSCKSLFAILDKPDFWRAAYSKRRKLMPNLDLTKVKKLFFN